MNFKPVNISLIKTLHGTFACRSQPHVTVEINFRASHLMPRRQGKLVSCNQFLEILQCHIFLFCRENVEALIKDINCQKDAMKKTGIVVDGRCLKLNLQVITFVCQLILTLYFFFILFYFFAMFLCYMSIQSCCSLIESILCLAVL